MLETRPDGSDPTTWLEPLADEDHRKADAWSGGIRVPRSSRL
jgi:hypothetical protein